MILGTNGRPVVELGGARAWKQYVKGDIVASLQWLDCGGDMPEPCLALYAARRRMDAGAYVITQGRAHEMADRHGNPTPALLRAGFVAAAQLGFHPDLATAHRCIDAIVEAIADLILMPSLPPVEPKKPERGIETVIRVNDEPVAEGVL